MQQLKHKYDRLMDEEEEGDLGSMSCSSDHDEDDDSSSSGMDGPSTASSDDGRDHGRLYDMSILVAQLPLKRGLSKFYDGKSQSFTSLANAKTLEDVAKADRSSCRKQKQQSRANVHTSVHSRAIAKAKTRPPSSGNGSSTCSSTLPAAKGRPPPLPPQRAS